MFAFTCQFLTLHVQTGWKMDEIGEWDVLTPPPLHSPARRHHFFGSCLRLEREASLLFLSSCSGSVVAFRNSRGGKKILMFEGGDGGAWAEVTVNGAELAGSPALIRALWGTSGSGRCLTKPRSQRLHWRFRTLAAHSLQSHYCHSLGSRRLSR